MKTPPFDVRAKNMSYLEERTCKQSANNQNIGTEEVSQCVAEEVAKRNERDNNIEKRKNNNLNIIQSCRS